MEVKRWNKWLWPAVVTGLSFLLAEAVASAERGPKSEASGDDSFVGKEMGASDYVLRVVNFLWQPNESSYQHVWPVTMPVPHRFLIISLFFFFVS